MITLKLCLNCRIGAVSDRFSPSKLKGKLYSVNCPVGSRPHGPDMVRKQSYLAHFLLEYSIPQAASIALHSDKPHSVTERCWFFAWLG